MDITVQPERILDKNLREQVLSAIQKYKISNLRGIDELLGVDFKQLEFPIKERAFLFGREPTNLADKLLEFWKVGFTLLQDHKPLKEEAENLLMPTWHNGLRQPPRNLSLFKGAGVNLIGELLVLSNSQEDPCVHFFTSILTLNFLQSNNIDQSIKQDLAIFALYFLVPLIRFYEKADLLGDLQDAALNVLSPYLQNFSKNKQNELLGIDASAIDIDYLLLWFKKILNSSDNLVVESSARKKSDLSFLLKYLEGDDWRDLIGFKFVVKGSTKAELVEVIEVMKNAGIIIDKISDTFEAPMKEDPDYKVLNLKIRIPVRFPDSNRKYLCVEVRLGLQNFDHTHPVYKMATQNRIRLTETEHNIRYIAHHLQNLFKKDMGIELEEDQKVEKEFKAFVDNLSNSTFLYTSTIKNVVFVSKEEEWPKQVYNQLIRFAASINGGMLTTKMFEIQRFEGGVQKKYRIQLVHPDNFIAYVVNENTGKLESVDLNQFALRNGDVVKIGEERLTINLLLRLIANAGRFEDVPVDLIMSNYANINEDILKNIWIWVHHYNQRIGIPDYTKDLRQADYANSEKISKEYEEFESLLRQQLIPRDLLNILYTSGHHLSSIQSSNLRSALPRIILPDLAQEIEALDSLEKIVRELFDPSKFITKNNKTGLNVWVNYFKSFSNQSIWPNQRIAHVMLGVLKNYLLDKLDLKIFFFLKADNILFRDFLKECILRDSDFAANFLYKFLESTQNLKSLDYEFILGLFPALDRLKTRLLYIKIKNLKKKEKEIKDNKSQDLNISSKEELLERKRNLLLEIEKSKTFILEDIGYYVNPAMES